jgi:hypothetical protein
VGWNESELEGSAAVAGDLFGGSVAISGARIVVGAASGQEFGGRGRAYVFTQTGFGWRQSAERSGIPGPSFGESVAISRTTVAVGGPTEWPASGRVYVFTKSAADWRRTAELKGSAELASDLATEAAELRLTCPDRRSKGARWVSSHATLVSGLSQEKKTRSSALLRMG